MGRCSKWLVVGVIAVFAIGSFCGRVDAQNSASPSVVTTRISITFDHVSLREALNSIFKKYNLKYQLSPKAAQILSREYITADFHEITLDTVLGSLLNPRECLVTVKSSVYAIDWKDPDNISFGCKDVLPVEALHKFFDSIEFNYLFAEECLPTRKITLPPITAHLGLVLQKLLECMKPAHLKVAQFDTLFVIYSPDFRYKHDEHEATIHYSLNSYVVSEQVALKSIFTSCQISYVLTPNLAGTVHLDETQEPFLLALDHILRQGHDSQTSDPLSYKVENNIFFPAKKHLSFGSE